MKTVDLSRFQPYEMTGVRAMFDVPAPEMLVQDFLPKGTTSALVSYPGVGKTWLSLELARAVCTGSPFLGRFAVPKVGNVVYVGQDASLHDYAQQLRKLVGEQYEEVREEIEQGLRHDNPFDEKFHFIIDPGFFFESTEAVLRMIKTLRGIVHGEQLEEFEGGRAKIVGEKGTDLVVFDTYSAMTRVNQNDNTLAEINFRNLRLIAKLTGASVVLLHHNSKRTEFNDGEDIRGASSQLAALDNQFQIIKPSKGPKNRYLVKFKRFRGLKPEDFHYTMDIDKDRAILSATQEIVPVAEVAPEGTPEATGPDPVSTCIIDCVASHPGIALPAAEIAAKTFAIGAQLTDKDLTHASWARKVRRRLSALVGGPYIEEGAPFKGMYTYMLKGVSDDSVARGVQPEAVDGVDADHQRSDAGGTEASDLAD